MIYNATLLVGKCPKAENVCDGLGVIVGNDVRSDWDGWVYRGCIGHRYDNGDRFKFNVCACWHNVCPPAGAADAVARTLHVPLRRSRARVEILEDQFLI